MRGQGVLHPALPHGHRAAPLCQHQKQLLDSNKLFRDATMQQVWPCRPPAPSSCLFQSYTNLIYGPEGHTALTNYLILWHFSKFDNIIVFCACFRQKVKPFLSFKFLILPFSEMLYTLCALPSLHPRDNHASSILIELYNFFGSRLIIS